MHGYEAKFIGGGPLARKKMHVRDTLPIQVAKPGEANWRLIDAAADGPVPFPDIVRGWYTPWAVDETSRRIVYVWDGWTK